MEQRQNSVDMVPIVAAMNVLILVVMEQRQNGTELPKGSLRKVLILVVMEQRQNSKIQERCCCATRLNPCCYGIEIEHMGQTTMLEPICLNPCCYGIEIEQSNLSVIIDRMFILGVCFGLRSQAFRCMQLGNSQMPLFFEDKCGNL